RAGVPRRWLDKNVLETRARFERRHQHRIETQSAGQAEVAALARHDDRSVLDRMLDPGGDVRAQSVRHGLAVLEPEGFVESCAETPMLQTFAAEVPAVDPGAALGQAEYVEE